jgi:hypothetical protein
LERGTGPEKWETVIGEENGGGDEYDQSTLCACVKISQ